MIESGPRAGEYLVSADTVDRLPEFYERVRKLPYKPGPAKQLAQVYQTISSNPTSTIYEDFVNSPGGLVGVVPPRWMLNLPNWAKAHIAGVAVWQWFGFALVLLLGALLVFGAYCLGRRVAGRGEDEQGPAWHSLLTPLAILMVAGVLIPGMCTILRIGGSPRVAIAFAQTILLFLSSAWLSMLVAGLLGETIVASERLRPRSLDSQLVRLGARFIGIVIAIALLMEAADDLGFPAFSVLAGLGVGGLAVALAARDSIANLLGSVLIMFEKPFRVGHRVRLSGTEGVVEDVGFRSTRIRTPDNSVISIPNNSIVNANVENLTLSTMSRQRLMVQVSDDTPRDKLEALADGIRQLIVGRSTTNKDTFYVHLNDFGKGSLNILVIFYLSVPDYAYELKEREAILMEIVDIGRDIGVKFAF
jgi:MscS family membrane protein